MRKATPRVIASSRASADTEAIGVGRRGELIPGGFTGGSSAAALGQEIAAIITAPRRLTRYRQLIVISLGTENPTPSGWTGWERLELQTLKAHSFRDTEYSISPLGPITH
jgi:hypothetical protein